MWLADRDRERRREKKKKKKNLLENPVVGGGPAAPVAAVDLIVQAVDALGNAQGAFGIGRVLDLKVHLLLVARVCAGGLHLADAVGAEELAALAAGFGDGLAGCDPVVPLVAGAVAVGRDGGGHDGDEEVGELHFGGGG